VRGDIIRLQAHSALLRHEALCLAPLPSALLCPLPSPPLLGLGLGDGRSMDARCAEPQFPVRCDDATMRRCDDATMRRCDAGNTFGSSGAGWKMTGVPDRQSVPKTLDYGAPNAFRSSRRHPRLVREACMCVPTAQHYPVGRRQGTGEVHGLLKASTLLQRASRAYGTCKERTGNRKRTLPPPPTELIDEVSKRSSYHYQKFVTKFVCANCLLRCKRGQKHERSWRNNQVYYVNRSSLFPLSSFAFIVCSIHTLTRD
jgi:hypothetical protein